MRGWRLILGFSLTICSSREGAYSRRANLRLYGSNLLSKQHDKESEIKITIATSVQVASANKLIHLLIINKQGKQIQET